MWIFLNNAFVSIVAHRDKPGFVLVRARRPGDIERAFKPDTGHDWVQVEETPNADYRFRAAMPAGTASEWIAKHLREITYDNFKNSIQDDRYHDACSMVWHDMLRLQNGGRFSLRGSISILGVEIDEVTEMEFIPDDDEHPYCDCSVHWDEEEMAANSCAACGRPIE